MKVAATGNTYRSINFGRSLNKTEMDNAYKVSLEARNLMGAQDGRGVLFLPSERLPKAQEGVGLTEQLEKFFDNVKKLLGINTVEITGAADEASAASVKNAIQGSGLERMGRFVIPQNRDELENAVEQAAKEFDALRVMTNDGNVSLEDINKIEETFKRVKGDAFKPSMLIYEHQDKAYAWDPDRINEMYKGRVIVGSSNYLNDNGGVLWGSNSFFTDRMGAKQGEFIHGLRNAFDSDLATQMSDGGQINAARNLLETELKLQDDEILHPARFAAAKRADVVLSNNFYKHFDDIAPKMSLDVENFEKIYQEALQQGSGDNYFDSLAKALKSLGLDKSNPDVYESVCKYRNALFASGAKTMEEAAALTAQELESSYKDVSNVVLQGVEIKRKALEDAKKLADFKEQHKEILEEGRKLGENMNPLDITRFDKFLNYVRKYKVQFIVGAALAALAIIGGTMYSYGKEIAQKSQAAKPKPDNIV